MAIDILFQQGFVPSIHCTVCGQPNPNARLEGNLFDDCRLPFAIAILIFLQEFEWAHMGKNAHLKHPEPDVF